MKKKTVVLVASLTLALGFAVGLLTSVIADSKRIERTLALRWDETQNNKARGQAHVYFEPGSNEKEVKLAVYFGREWIYGPRTLGWVQTKQEGVAKWGQIDWRVDGLHVGTGTNQFFVKRDDLPQ